MADLLYLKNKRRIDKDKLKIGFIHEGLKMENLKVTISESDDITVNGRLIRKESAIPFANIEVVADVFNENKELLLSLRSYKSFNFKDNPIESFNCYCVNVKRFFDDEIATIEVYTRVKSREEIGENAYKDL